MKAKLLLTTTLLILSMTCPGQQPTWESWNWLIGEWKGEGSGLPGQGGGTFSFSFDLDKRILVRKSHSEYPAPNNKPSLLHDDLMIVYPEHSTNPGKAIYFDNEGHVIHYSISYSGNSIILTSEVAPNVPIFRLTYTALGKEVVNTKFEMSRDGVTYTTYIEGKSNKIK